MEKLSTAILDSLTFALQEYMYLSLNLSIEWGYVTGKKHITFNFKNMVRSYVQNFILETNNDKNFHHCFKNFVDRYKTQIHKLHAELYDYIENEYGEDFQLIDLTTFEIWIDKQNNGGYEMNNKIISIKEVEKEIKEFSKEKPFFSTALTNYLYGQINNYIREAYREKSNFFTININQKIMDFFMYNFAPILKGSPTATKNWKNWKKDFFEKYVVNYIQEHKDFLQTLKKDISEDIFKQYEVGFNFFEDGFYEVWINKEQDNG